MAAQYTIVQSLKECRSAVKELERESEVAVDAEGVNVSVTGPLTLLQIATFGGYVYLFDVKREPRLFEEGGLKKFLENSSIVKVMSSSKDDFGALRCQFNVSLQGVFDIQIAQMEIDRLKGRQLPERLKLEDIVAEYSKKKAEFLTEGKDALRKKWNKTDGEYWDKRPLTEEMIQFACKVVTVLVPEVYRKQKRMLERQGLMEQFQEHVQQDTEGKLDKRTTSAKHKECDQTTVKILKDYARKVTARTTLADLAEEKDVLAALNQVNLKYKFLKTLPQSILDLRLQFFRAKLNDIEEELVQKGDNLDPSTYMFSVISTCISHSDDEDLKGRAKELQRNLQDIVIKDIGRKYTMTTPVSYLAKHEKIVLSDKRFRLKGQHDENYHPVVARLYWLVKLEEVESKKKLYDYTGDFTDGFERNLRFYCVNDVPESLKSTAKVFLEQLESSGRVAWAKSSKSKQK